MDTEENIFKEKPSEIVCTFCMKPTCQDFANIQQKSDLLELLKKLNVDILPINDQIDWICYQCTYKLNCIRDYARTWASCVTKNRINYYYRLGEKEMVRRLLNLKDSKPLRSLSIDAVIDQHLGNSSHNKNELKLKISSVRSLGVNDIPKLLTTTAKTIDDKEQLQKHDEKNTENVGKIDNDIKNNKINNENDHEIGNENDHESKQDTSHNNDNGNDNEIDYNRGTPEQELLSVMYEKSESVINTESGHTYYRNKKNNTPTLLTCKKCHRVYKKLSFLKKHERKHEKDILKSTIIQTPKVKAAPIKCKDCERTFTTLTTWRKHYQIHQSRLKCVYCPAVFILPADLEMHEAVCYGVTCAKGKSEQSHRYMTRSAHRTSFSDENSDNLSSEADTMYTKRLRNARDWVDKTINSDTIQTDNNETEQTELIDDDGQSLATTFTRASSRFNSTFTEGEGDDDDDLSTLTRPSASSKNTTERLKKRNKETDLLNGNAHKRSKISQNILNKLVQCPDKNCNFITTSMIRLQEHDLTVHDELALFSCTKCQGRFLRQFYLKDHLSDQNPGRFLCTKCERIFTFEGELKFHQIEHDISDDNKSSNYCKCCKLTFTNLSDYYNHLETLTHKKNAEIDEKIKPENFEYQKDDNEEEQQTEKEIESEIVEEANLFKNEKKIVNNKQILKNDTSTLNLKTDMPIKIEIISDDETEEKSDFKIKKEKRNSSTLKMKTDIKKSIKLRRVEPYKSEIRIRQFGKAFRRRHDVVFRQWKPPSEPLRMIGANYLNCAIKPYRNLS